MKEACHVSGSAVNEAADVVGSEMAPASHKQQQQQQNPRHL
jgi:hypothetical protein